MAAGSLQAQLPDGPGKDLTAAICGKCHGTDLLSAHRQGKEEWTQAMLKMVELGATGTEEQFNTILGYLTENFGPRTSAIPVNKATAAELESGLGILPKEAKAIVKYREEKGAYKTIDDLKKVADLDFKKIEAVKDRLAFN
jgi:competence protein ComEA